MVRDETGGRPVSVPRALSRRRRLAERLLIALTGFSILAVAVTWAPLGPLLALGYIVLLAPGLMRRWNAPYLPFVLGFFAFMFWAHLGLNKFGALAVVGLVPILSWHYIAMPIVIRALWLATRGPAWFVLPVGLAAEEFIRPLIGVGSFNMYEIGVFLFDWPILIQAADLVGGLGLTVLWSIPFAAAVEVLRWRLEGGGDGARRRALWGIALAIAVVGFLTAYGSYRLHTARYEPGPRLAIVQPSVEHKPWKSDEVVQAQLRMTIDRLEPGAADLIVWPENAMLIPYDEREDYREIARVVASRLGAPFLFGTQAYGPDGRRPTASAYLITETGEFVGRYDKNVLFPFTERRAFPWLQRMIPWLDRQVQALTRAAWGVAPDGWAGRTVTVFRVETPSGTYRFATPMCYDSCYEGPCREAARRGAQFFINLTSEGFIGWSTLHNQQGANILRAVENRRGLVRVGNTGPSGFFLPDGRVDVELRGEKRGWRILDEGVLVHRVALGPDRLTVYSRFGAWIDRIWTLVWLGAVIAAVVRAGLARRGRARGDA